MHTGLSLQIARQVQATFVTKLLLLFLAQCCLGHWHVGCLLLSSSPLHSVRRLRMLQLATTPRQRCVSFESRCAGPPQAIYRLSLVPHFDRSLSAVMRNFLANQHTFSRLQPFPSASFRFFVALQAMQRLWLSLKLQNLKAGGDFCPQIFGVTSKPTMRQSVWALWPVWSRRCQLF